MATVVDDQAAVSALGSARAWKRAHSSPQDPGSIITCLGYHPWFTHRYSLIDTPLPSKEEHYLSLFFTPNSSPTSKNRQLLSLLLPHLPEPIPFAPLLARLRTDLTASLAQGNLTMLGEVGLDAQARMRWPPSARSIWEDQHPGADRDKGRRDGDDDSVEWRRLTPFRTNMVHQRAILALQLDLAVDLGLNISLHSVACPGPTLDALLDLRERHGHAFGRINVDLHSAGGWSPDFYAGAQKRLRNLYASPSVLITGRVAHADALVRVIERERVLVESDSHDARLMAGLVWRAVEWVARVRGWKVERGEEEWVFAGEEEEEVFGEKGEVVRKREEEVWAVHQLELNWARFMRIIE